jgi:hypothetical protein
MSKNDQEDDLGLTAKRTGVLLACAAGMYLLPPPLNAIATVLTGWFFLRQIRFLIREVKGFL